MITFTDDQGNQHAFATQKQYDKFTANGNSHVTREPEQVPEQGSEQGKGKGGSVPPTPPTTRSIASVLAFIREGLPGSTRFDVGKTKNKRVVTRSKIHSNVHNFPHAKFIGRLANDRPTKIYEWGKGRGKVRTFTYSMGSGIVTIANGRNKAKLHTKKTS